MATIVTKNSSTASAVPTTSDLVQGELAVNVTDKRIFTENASTQIVELGTNPSTITTATATVTSTLTANGTFASNNAVITGGSINSTPIGATTPSTVRGSTVTATTGFVGGLTGNVTGNLTGNVTGNVVGNLTGNVTGNVTASSGTTTLNDLVVNGTADFTNTKLTNITTPTASTDAANKGYVDATVAAVIDSAPAALDTLNELAAALGDDANFSATVTTALATKLPLAGGTMTGAIAMGTSKITGLGDPTASQDAATKIYVDTADNLKLNLSGGTMSGAIAMGTNKITGLGDPTLAQDAATKAYTDSILGSATSAAASAAAAATSESNAATSASNASTSETNALNSANAAASSYDQFDDRYLGDKASDPTLDNDGNALLTGALYFNTTTDVMRVYNGSAWQDTAISPNSPTFTGTVTADSASIGTGATGTNQILINGSGSSTSVMDLRMTGGGTGNPTSILRHTASTKDFSLLTGNAGVELTRLLVTEGGDISFYEDTGTTAKFFWDASAESLGIGGQSPAGTAFTVTNGGAEGLEIRPTGGLSGGTSITAYNRSGAAYIPQTYNASEHIFVNSGSSNEKMRIDSSGNLLVGTTASLGKLTVESVQNNITTGTFTSPALRLSNSNVTDTTGFTGIAYSGSAVNNYGWTSGVQRASTNGTELDFIWRQHANSAVGTERMRITSEGNVGIGTASPGVKLEIFNGADADLVMLVRGNDLTSEYLGFGVNGPNSVITAGASGVQSTNMVFRTALSGSEAEAMRIDSSGNLLVGKTVNNVTTAGVNLNSSGYVSSSVSSNPAAYFNRGTSDGNIAVFLKDGTTVGSIGSVGAGSELYIAGNTTGLQFSDTAADIRPCTASGSASDATTDLGDAVARFKNAYFSGTVNANAFVGDGSGLTGVGGGGAMELISTTTVSGTPSTIDITSGFSSTYDDYVIYGSGIIGTVTDDGRIRVYKGGSLLTSDDYTYLNRNGTYISSRDSFDNAWSINNAAPSTGFKINIVNANSSKFSISCFGGYYSSGIGWNHSGSGSFTGIRIYPAGGTFTAGTIKLYGIKKS